MKSEHPAIQSCSRAFSLVELLVVMAIIGLLASFGVPALRGFGQSNSFNAAIRQLKDDLGLARLYAITERTTVYMVFLPPFSPGVLPPNLTGYTEDEKLQITNLVSGQYTAYNFFTARTIGDQPAGGIPRFITDWKYLPEGIFIQTNKFDDPAKLTGRDSVVDTIAATNRPFYFKGENVFFRFPLSTSSNTIRLPYVAFNYQGRLTRDQDEFIRLTKGSLINERTASRAFLLQPPEVVETPRGNSTNNPYIRIDWLTGRASVITPIPGT